MEEEGLERLILWVNELSSLRESYLDSVHKNIAVNYFKDIVKIKCNYVYEELWRAKLFLTCYNKFQNHVVFPNTALKCDFFSLWLLCFMVKNHFNIHRTIIFLHQE